MSKEKEIQNKTSKELDFSPLILDNFKSEELILNAERKVEIFKNENQIENSDSVKAELIPTYIKILFSLPAFSKMSCLLILNVHALIFYESKGSSLLLISFFTALARCLEIFIKPVIAHWSDTSNFRIGRRKPFMLIGCSFYALFLVLLFTLPKGVISPVSTSIWFGVFYILFFIADTVCNIPYVALGPELSRDTREREKLYLVFYFFQYIGVLFASGAPVLIQKFLFNSCDCQSCDSVILNKEECIRKCESLCAVDGNEMSLLIICMFVGLFFIVSIVLLSYAIKERKESFNKDESYLVPTLFRIINNGPFMRLLFPWILDATITQIYATMLPFFVSFVINPQNYCVKNKISLTYSVCIVSNWIGITIFAFFIFLILFMGFWHWIVGYLGKKKVWMAYSLISIVTYSLFLFLDEGMMIGLVVLSAINAFPGGAGYLNDAFFSDTIDYDEFITGKRSEGIYMVFSSYTPKLVGIFAQSIPLTVMSVLGFIPSNSGRMSEQPKEVKEFIRFYFIGVPVLLALISFLCKMNYPIDSEEKMNKLKKSISLQNEKCDELKKSVDFYKIKNPIYCGREHIHIFSKSPEHVNSILLADHFDDLEYLELIRRGELHVVRCKLIFISFMFLSFTLISSITLVLTFKYLEVKSLSIVPLISLFAITICLSLLIINAIRLRIINKVIKSELKIDYKYISLYIYKIKAINDEDSEEKMK